MRNLKRIVSGGQTGADRAALDFAIDHGIEHGGWCPQGRLAEDGVIPEAYRLREMPGEDYRQRTRQNVVDSDGTLILNLGKLEGGTLETSYFAENLVKPNLVLQLDQEVGTLETAAVTEWLGELNIRILNVAGPRESKRPGIYQLTYQLLERCWSDFAG